MTRSAAAGRRLVALLVLLVCLVTAPGALAAGTAAPPPPDLAETLGRTGTPAVVSYGDLLTAARRGTVNAAVVDTSRYWVEAVDRSGNLIAAPIPEPKLGSDFGDEDGEAAPANAPTAFQLGDWLRERRVVVLEPAAAAESSGPSRSVWGLLGLPLMLALLFGSIVLIAAVNNRRRQGGSGGGRRSGGAGAHGRMRKSARILPPDTRFTDVAGCDEAVDELAEVVAFLKSPERFAKVGARMPRGVILFGPPGTGKTLLARAVAGEAGVPFYATSGSDFVDTFVGVGASRVRDLFSEARKQETGAIIFFDEIDAIGRQRGGGMSGSDSEREATLNQLLVELDGFGARDRIVVVAATNRVDMLDQALTRPGRFDRRVQVGLPAEAGRRAILGLYADGKPLESLDDLDRIATVTAGFAGADLANLLNEAAIMAARDGREAITAADLDEGMLRAIAGPEKRDRTLAPGELEIIAWHEAGHCLAAELCPTHTKTQRVTILPRGDAGGLALYGSEDRALTSPQRLHERMVVAMAGRAAEQIGFGVISSGAANDLEQANRMARQAVEKLGFSSRVGQIALPTNAMGTAMSEETRSLIESEVADMVDAAYRDAVALLQEHREVLEALALTLLEREQINRDMIEQVVGTATVGEAVPRARPQTPRPERVMVEVTPTAPAAPPERRRRLPARVAGLRVPAVRVAPALRPLGRSAANLAGAAVQRGRVRVFRRTGRGAGTTG